MNTTYNLLFQLFQSTLNSNGTATFLSKFYNAASKPPWPTDLVPPSTVRVYGHKSSLVLLTLTLNFFNITVT